MIFRLGKRNVLPFNFKHSQCSICRCLFKLHKYIKPFSSLWSEALSHCPMYNIRLPSWDQIRILICHFQLIPINCKSKLFPTNLSSTDPNSYYSCRYCELSRRQNHGERISSPNVPAELRECKNPISNPRKVLMRSSLFSIQRLYKSLSPQ